MVFNVAGRKLDDHTCNIFFLMNSKLVLVLVPAFNVNLGPITSILNAIGYTTGSVTGPPRFSDYKQMQREAGKTGLSP